MLNIHIVFFITWKSRCGRVCSHMCRIDPGSRSGLSHPQALSSLCPGLWSPPWSPPTMEPGLLPPVPPPPQSSTSAETQRACQSVGCCGGVWVRVAGGMDLGLVGFSLWLLTVTEDWATGVVHE